MPATTTRNARKRGKQPAPVPQLRGLTSAWDVFGPIFQEIRWRLDPESRVRFDELFHSIPDPHIAQCATCRQMVMVEATVLELLKKVIEQVVLPDPHHQPVPLTPIQRVMCDVEGGRHD